MKPADHPDDPSVCGVDSRPQSHVLVSPSQITREWSERATRKRRRAPKQAELESIDPDAKPIRKRLRDRGDGGGR